MNAKNCSYTLAHIFISVNFECLIFICPKSILRSATCDKHGVLIKKTKGLLRNMKTYQCVAASGVLYLYLKETDERQRKVM